MNARRSMRRGVAMLEAILALLLFGLVVTSLIELNRAIIVANAKTRDTEIELTEANRLMESVAQWSSEDLVRRLGAHQQGAFSLNVVRLTPVLFSTTLSNVHGKVLLETALYRPCCTPGS